MPTTKELAGRIRARARGLANELGYDVHKLREETEQPAEPVRQRTTLPTTGEAVAQLLDSTNPRSVIDVGANVGQFALLARKKGFAGPIVSFEPQPEEHRALTSAAEHDPQWIIAPRCALGASDGTAQIHRSGNSQSSSILEMLDLVTDHAPTAAYVDSVETPVRRLDDVMIELDIDPSGSLLKIDTQGFETEVLRGAPYTLSRIVAAHLELSLVPLYAEQALASEVFALLGDAGLELTLINECFNADDGRILQIDGGFTRIGAQK